MKKRPNHQADIKNKKKVPQEQILLMTKIREIEVNI